MPPLVSVVIPNYNYARYLGECIGSVLSQTYKPVECIVVDDGSTDDSVDVINSYGDSVKLVRQKNRGKSAARNAGIRAASGEWIAFLDADDMWHPMKLEVQMKVLDSRPDWRFISTETTSLDSFQDITAKWKTSEILLKDLFTSTPIGTSSVLVKKECLSEVGLFDENLKWVEDRDLWLRLVSRFKGGKVHAGLCRYRSHPAQHNRKAHFVNDGREKVLNQFFEANPHLKKYRRIAYAHHHYMAGLSMRDNALQPGISIIHFIKSMLFYPLNYQDNISKQRLKCLAVAIANTARRRRSNNTPIP